MAKVFQGACKERGERPDQKRDDKRRPTPRKEGRSTVKPKGKTSK